MIPFDFTKHVSQSPSPGAVGAGSVGQSGLSQIAESQRREGALLHGIAQGAALVSGIITQEMGKQKAEQEASDIASGEAEYKRLLFEESRRLEALPVLNESGGQRNDLDQIIKSGLESVDSKFNAWKESSTGGIPNVRHKETLHSLGIRQEALRVNSEIGAADQFVRRNKAASAARWSSSIRSIIESPDSGSFEALDGAAANMKESGQEPFLVDQLIENAKIDVMSSMLKNAITGVQSNTLQDAEYDHDADFDLLLEDIKGGDQWATMPEQVRDEAVIKVEQARSGLAVDKNKALNDAKRQKATMEFNYDVDTRARLRDSPESVTSAYIIETAPTRESMSAWLGHLKTVNAPNVEKAPQSVLDGNTVMASVWNAELKAGTISEARLLEIQKSADDAMRSGEMMRADYAAITENISKYKAGAFTEQETALGVGEKAFLGELKALHDVGRVSGKGAKSRQGRLTMGTFDGSPEQFGKALPLQGDFRHQVDESAPGFFNTTGFEETVLSDQEFIQLNSAFTKWLLENDPTPDERETKANAILRPHTQRLARMTLDQRIEEMFGTNASFGNQSLENNRSKFGDL